ncbi:aminopeptidase N isoform X1 [Drosophila teissieri]|uniref:aminopeptidase N isoform X1 n=2 Tax=Drosophila teissieri TaxID=7243 RepID=UPI001CBA4937|nr:aminopeptidase N isoform X1 [Drosophila teissieri]
MLKLPCYLIVLHLIGAAGAAAPNLRPLHYNLSLLTEVDPVKLSGTFSGEVIIRLRVWRETRTIVLSKNGLRVGPKVLLFRSNTGGRVTVRKVWHIRRLHQYGIVFNSMLWLGEEYSLVLQFSGRMSRAGGYFVGGYMDTKDHSQWIAVTQLAPNLANTVFPCFENRTFLAPFILNLAHPRGTNAVSNMRVRKIFDHENDDYIWTSFHQTPAMSVQRLAFSINRFTNRTSAEIAKGPAVTTWLRPKIADQGDYAIRITSQIIVYFVGLFGKPYPATKIDQLILPDTAYQSHEHLGLVSYPEAAFLYSEQHSSTRAKQGVASHVAREFAHHWLSDLENAALHWLHYGLSDYVAGFAVDNVEPAWRFHELTMLRQALAVLDEDAGSSAQPVSLAHALMSSDTQAYHKSALLFRMLHSLIGTQVFVNALRLYLQRSPKGSSSNQAFLWHTLQEESDRQMSLRQDIKVSQLMDSWTMQPGYPLIRVMRNYATNQVTVTQERFLRNPGKRMKRPQHCWWVPLTFASAGRVSFVSTLPSEWLTCRAKKENASRLILNEVAQPDEWVVFNLRLATPCRVTYDERNWQLIGKALSAPNASSIDRFTRAQLISDVLNLAAAGVVTYDLALNFLGHLRDEDEFIVWQAAGKCLEWLYRTLRNTAIISTFKGFVRGLLQAKFDELFKSDAAAAAGKENITELMVIVLQLSCQTDLQSCADFALQEFAGLTLATNRIPVDLRETIYCTAIQFGTEADWTLLRRLYKRSDVSEERRIILSALACSRENWAMDKLLGLAFVGQYLPKDDVLLIFSAVAQNPFGYTLAKKYLVNNIKAIIKLYGSSTDELAQLVTVLMKEVTTERELNAVRMLMKTDLGNLPGFKTAFRRILEVGHDNIAWHSRQYHNVLAAVCNITGSIEPQCIY